MAEAETPPEPDAAPQDEPDETEGQPAGTAEPASAAEHEHQGDEHEHQDGDHGHEHGHEHGAVSEEAFSVEAMMQALRQAKVAELLISTISTLASVAYGKLEVPDLPEAKVAIDAIGALSPLLAGQVDDGIHRDVEQALANLRLAYADAVSKAQ